MLASSSSNAASNPFFVRVDWRETPEAHVIEGDFPGMNEADVKVRAVDDTFLEITGERVIEKEEKNGTAWRMVQRARGKFMRRFRLPDNANLAELETVMKYGVLTVTVLKKPDSEMSTGADTSNVLNPYRVLVDWKETPVAHIFTFDYPGKEEPAVKVNALNMTGDDDIFLEFSGECIIHDRRDSKSTAKWHMLERPRGKFLRRIRLPKNVPLERYTNERIHNVRAITVPKNPGSFESRGDTAALEFDAASALLDLHS